MAKMIVDDIPGLLDVANRELGKASMRIERLKLATERLEKMLYCILTDYEHAMHVFGRPDGDARFTTCFETRIERIKSLLDASY